MTNAGGGLIRDARVRAGLSQRELARRARTSQATIAAYESGRVTPSLKTFSRILRAAGFDLRMRITPHDRHDEWLDNYEGELSAQDKAAFHEAQRSMIERGRKRFTENRAGHR